MSIASRAVKAVSNVLKDVRPQVGIVLGSGMGSFAESSLDDVVSISYEDIPDFPVSTVSGHAGRLVIGNCKGVRVACFQGRVHLYEGVDPQNLRVPMYLVKGIGCESVLLTTAVGSLREDVGPGELVLIKDHINFQARNPLIGPNDEEAGTRFPSLLNAYVLYLTHL